MTEHLYIPLSGQWGRKSCNHSCWFSLVLDQRTDLLPRRSCVQCCERCQSLQVLSWYLPCCTPPWVLLLLSPVSVFVSSCHTFLFLSFLSPAPSRDTHSADPVKVEVALGKCPCNVSVVLGCICAPLILNSQVWLTHSSQGWVLQLHWLSQSKLTQSKWSEKIQEKWQTFSELIFMYLCTNFHRRQSLIAKWRNVDQWRDNQAKHQSAKHMLLTGRMNSTHPAWTVRHELISSFWNNTINFTLSHRDICIPNRHSHIKFSNNYNKTFMTIKYGAIKQR